MDITALYALFKSSDGIATDTRNTLSKKIYFALKGDHFDGNDFALDALSKGAIAAVVDRPALKDRTDKIFFVDDVLKKLQELAHFHRKKCKTTIISITGSNGKTTTKELIKTILSENFSCQATEGNLNNHIGVPLTLLKLKETTQFGIVEMGANHQGEIAFLCKIAAPDWGYITNFGKAHLEGFGGLDGVIKGKTELYRYLTENKGNILVHADDAEQEKAVGTYSVIRFGKNSTDDYCIQYSDAIDDELCIQFSNRKLCCPLYGAYNLPNIAAATALGIHLGVSLEQISSALSCFETQANRSQLIQKGKYSFVLDAYNANPTSTKAALMSFAQKKAESKGIILGDMLELGVEAFEEHQKIVFQALAMKFEEIYLVGSLWPLLEIEHSKIKIFEASEVLRDYFVENPSNVTTLLLKGSRGIALEKILDAF